jgi:hypothetical protein
MAIQLTRKRLSDKIRQLAAREQRKDVAAALLRRAVLIEVLTEADSDGAGESVRPSKRR